MFSLLEICFFGVLTDEFMPVAAMILVAYYFAPFYSVSSGGQLGTGLMYLTQILACCAMIFYIPMDLGGMRSFRVDFCQPQTDNAHEDLCQNYLYLGEANGFFQFRDGDTVILRSTDSGYIKYQKDAIREIPAESD